MDNLALEAGVPVRDRLLPYGQQWIDDNDITAVVDVLKSDFITQGPKIAEFEQSIAVYAGAKYAVAFSSGTAALHGACFAAGIGPGDEVITTPITFVASSNCALYQGAKPVFADVKRDTYNLDPDDVQKRVTERTKAIIPVDFTGQPVEMDRLKQIAGEHDLVIIHDAAHSLGAEFSGQKVGSLADMTMFSFHPVKHITTGEGGIIVTDNEAYYKRLQLFRSHGITKDASILQKDDGPWYYEMHALGYHYRMTDIQAALGLSQLTKLNRFLERRREIAKTYTDAFNSLEGVICPYQHEKTNSAWHLYILRFDLSKFKVGRKKIFEALRAENIGVHVHYIPVYYQPYYQQLGYLKGLCPEAEKLYEEIITIPIFPGMTDQDVQDVIRAVKKVHEHYIKKA